MATDRIIFGTAHNLQAQVQLVQDVLLEKWIYLENYQTGTDFTTIQMLRWNIGDTVEIIYSDGTSIERTIKLVEGIRILIDTYYPQFPFGFPQPITIGNKIINKSSSTHGLTVSVPGVDVTNGSIAHTGNLIFDSTTFVESALYAVQSGSFVLAGYKHRHDPVFHAGNRTSVSISFAESKPDGQELDIPIVMMQFAVCNSIGHFHPNYANQANSQILDYMDSVWVKQLNVIGGTLNTESMSIASEGIDTSELPDPNSPDFIRARGQATRASPMKGVYAGRTPPWPAPLIQSETPADPVPYTDMWNVAHHKPTYDQSGSSWETLVHPGWEHTGWGDLQSDPTWDLEGSIVGRRGYWKQKTWGLIYYVDHNKLIVQAFNDKSTSNAMIKTTGNLNRDAWDNNAGDLGRVIGTKSYKFDLSIGGGTAGAFNHNIFHGGTSYAEGAGYSVFDYYHVGAGKSTKTNKEGPNQPYPWSTPQQRAGEQDIVGPRWGWGGGYFGNHVNPTTPHGGTQQEHMPRPYLGGYDNMMWDNVPLHGTFNKIDSTGFGADKSTPEYSMSTYSPWMGLSSYLPYQHSYGDRGGYDTGDSSAYPYSADVVNGNALYHHLYTQTGQLGHPHSGVWGPVNWYTWFGMNDGDTHYGSWSGPAHGLSSDWNAAQDQYVDNHWRPWLHWEEFPERCGTLSYREAITPNTEVTTILTNHFNPLSDVYGGETLDKNGNPYGWDYFFVTYVVFNQSTGMKHDPTLSQDNYPYSTIVVDTKLPIEPWTGQPLHD